MIDRNDGGPAFPQNDAGTNRINNLDGMSLRDYFAGQALAGMLGDATRMGDISLYAQAAYTFADAMLAERAKGAAK